jgi:hypothetical protein
MDVGTYLSQRIDGQLDWLTKASQHNKLAFLRYRLLGIGLGSLITILSPYAGQPGPLKAWISPLLQLSGAGVAISGSLLALHRHQENWLRYRHLKENLEREKMLFLTGSSEAYAEPDAFQCFVRIAEAIMAEERASWARQASDKTAPHRPEAEQAATVPSPEGEGPRAEVLVPGAATVPVASAAAVQVLAPQQDRSASR